METLHFLGIDVSKETLDLCLLDNSSNTLIQAQIHNNRRGLTAFFKQIKKLFNVTESKLILCMEHTGLYCNPVLDFASKLKLQVCLESALQIKQTQGITRGKSDKVDARRIALYASRYRDTLRMWRPQRDCIKKLKALLTARERLVRIRVQIKTPIAESNSFCDKSLAKDLAASFSRTLKAIECDLEKIEGLIKKIISHDAEVSQQLKYACSVPGIGMITALNVIIATNEFVVINNPKKFACYAGVAPFEHSSGTSVRGKTSVSNLANMRLKGLLHMAALSAIQSSTEIQEFYSRKVTEGKNKMSVINSVRNKLITRVFSCVKNQRTYEKKSQVLVV